MKYQCSLSVSIRMRQSDVYIGRGIHLAIEIDAVTDL